ncbi:ABC transporter substrate-binding protein [Embleya sp. NBC_00896]|uniref:ABC transporter substrate-binding protein n=1 Tax=Embleya sp. NBC_00896 TaxID=2975961 RepID=UPI002F910E1E|nr:ABC transporter substrate-binding protein [Embleya sp. NBC_00896]
MDTPFAHVRSRRAIRVLAACLTLSGTLSLAACGGSSHQTSKATGQVDSRLHDLLPSAIKKSGTLTVATGKDYPPLVSLGSDNKTLVGLEPDLIKAIGGVLGVKVQLTPASFDSLIAGVQSRRFNVAIEAMLDKPERRQAVTFVDYFKTSSSILTDQKHADTISSLDSLCGTSVGVEQGTAQVDDVQTQNRVCADSKRPGINVLTFPNSVDCFQALSTGRVDAFVGGTPTIAHQADNSDGRFKQVGTPYRFLPYGILINKDDGPLVQAVQQALQKLVDNGEYGKLLVKWKLESGNIGSATVNGGQQ